MLKTNAIILISEGGPVETRSMVFAQNLVEMWTLDSTIQLHTQDIKCGFGPLPTSNDHQGRQ